LEGCDGKIKQMTKWRLDPGQIEVVDDAVAEILRRKTPAERVAMVLEANRVLRLRITSHIQSVHPEWDSNQVAAAVTKRMTRGAS